MYTDGQNEPKSSIFCNSSNSNLSIAVVVAVDTWTIWRRTINLIVDLICNSFKLTTIMLAMWIHKDK